MTVAETAENPPVLTVHEMETQVPPGAGDRNIAGIITGIDDSLVVASQSSAVRQLTIGDTAIQVLAATQINDDVSPLAVGNYAVVNSYVANGGHVATRISGIVVNSRLYLPVTQR